MSGIVYGTRQRPGVICPNCGSWHGIMRRGDHLAKEQLRFRCGNCKTAWPATDEQRGAIREYYQTYAQKKQEKQNSSAGEKPKKQSVAASDPSKKAPGTTRKSSFWDNFGI